MGDLENWPSICVCGAHYSHRASAVDGKDGHVHIEFYGKPAANPLVRLRWTDAQGKQHEKQRNLPALAGDFEPRLIQARVKAGAADVERLTWSLPADFSHDKYHDWLKLEGQEQVERTIFSVEQAQGQIALARTDARRRYLSR